MKKTYLFLIACLIFFYSNTGICSVEKLNQWSGGPCDIIAINEINAFMGNGGFLGIVDLETFSLISNTLIADDILSIHTDNNILYIAASYKGVIIMDVADPSNPVIIATIDDLFGMNCIIEGDRLFIAAGGTVLYVYDISNPQAPQLLGSQTGMSYFLDFAVKGNYVYTALYGSGIKIIDVTDPANMAESGDISIVNSTAWNIKINGDHLYTGSNSTKGFQIFNVFDPSSPQSVVYVENIRAYKFDFLDNTMFVATFDSLRVYNITNPEIPVELFAYGGVLSSDVAVTPGYVCIKDENNGISLLPLTEENEPKEIHSIEFDFFSLGMYTDGNLFYFPVYDKKLKVFDMTNLNNIIELGTATYNFEVDQIEFYEDYLFMPYIRKIYIAKTGEDLIPQSVASIKLDDSWDLKIISNYPYLYAYSSDVVIKDYNIYMVNVSQPESPVLGATLEGGTSYGSASIIGDYLFLLGRNKQLHCVNINSQEMFQFESKSFFPDSTIGFWIYENYGYMTNTEGLLKIYDMTDPLSPVLKNTMNTNLLADKPLFYGNSAYGAGFMGKNIYDFSNPENPIQTGFLSIPGYTGDAIISEGRLFVQKIIMEDKVEVFDLSQPFNPGHFGNINSPFDETEALAVKDDIVFAACGNGGLKVFDFANQNNCQIAQIGANGSVEEIAIQDNYAYLVDTKVGMRIVDISNPNNPSIVGEYSMNNHSGNDIIVKDGYAYVLGGTTNRVIDISNPLQPESVGEIPDCESYSDSQGHFYNGYLYIADKNGIRVMDVSDPTILKTLTTISTDGYASDICCKDGYAFVADGNEYMRVLDVSTPTSPVEVASLEIPNSSLKSIDIYDHYVFLASSWSNIYIIDVIDPLQPVLFDRYYNYSSEFSDVSFNNGKIYCTDRAHGVFQLGHEIFTSINEQNKYPSHFELFSNYPNPFNPTTSIPYSLPQSAHVKMDIYNIKGQHIKTIVDENQFPGIYETQWDATSNNGKIVSSGVYFYRIKAGKYFSTKKMLFIR